MGWLALAVLALLAARVFKHYHRPPSTFEEFEDRAQDESVFALVFIIVVILLFLKLL